MNNVSVNYIVTLTILQIYIFLTWLIDMDDFECWMCKIDTCFYFVLIDANALLLLFLFSFLERISIYDVRF